MNHFQSPEESSLDSALLLLSRKPKTLASLLAHYLPPSVLQRLARLAGRRRRPTARPRRRGDFFQPAAGHPIR